MEITKRTSGVSLLEVLAAIFVVSIGLLGVLAVIPFGAFQVSKAQHAEYASNMLANAAEEILIREMVKPRTWGVSNLASDGDLIFERVQVTLTVTQDITQSVTETWMPDPTDPSNTENITYNLIYQVRWVNTNSVLMLNCEKFLWVEPRRMNISPEHLSPEHLFYINRTSTANPAARWEELMDEWSELMRGQDDLVYSTYADKRPDFVGQNNKIQSSGKYTWLFTIPPQSIARMSNPVSVGSNLTVTMSTDPPIILPLMPLSSFPPVPPMDRIPFNSAFTPSPPSIVPGSVQYVPVNPPFPPGFTPSATPNTGHTYPLVRHYFFADAVDPNTIVPVSVLAGYNRVTEDDRQVAVQPENFAPSRGGGTFTFPNADHLELLTQTKHVFVTWETSTQITGAWCKIVFLDKSNPSSPKVIVTGDLDAIGNNIQILIPSGVLYHKRVENVPIW